MTNSNPNRDNLDLISTSEEARKRGSAGGKASVKVRRERKAMREQMMDLLNIPQKTGKVTNFDKVKSQKDIQSGNFTVEQQILLATVQKARKGDMRAVQMIRDIIGISDQQKPVSPLDKFAEDLDKYRDDDDDDGDDVE